MLTIVAFDATGPRPVGDAGEMSELIGEPDALVWCDVRQPVGDELAVVRDAFALHPLAIEDATDHGVRPKLSHFDTHAFVVAHYSDLRTCELVEVDLFIGPNWLLTVHGEAERGGSFDVDGCRERVLRRMHPDISASFLAYLVLDEIVDSYGATVDRLVAQVEVIEAEVFDAPDPEHSRHKVQHRMHLLRRELLEFRRRVGPLNEVLAMLERDELPFIDRRTRQYLQDVHDHVARVTDDVDMYRAVIDHTVDAHLALVSNHQNDVMKFMTSWGAILIVSTIIAGIYGMNFEHMPELTWQFGYPLALGMMLTATLLLYRYFKRKDWI